ncbi:putative isoleucyl-tRNA synthetase [Triangularia verruculosa]|uniref:Isoleucyl-tRNA synthetase n=1 Tax=Triangularia verruculosa TaxID=2587418 RepID=A0AAN6X9S6_9PEZI|nr:putative isoleucyl-tRNA synthetase [Triangularia verruculosa]
MSRSDYAASTALGSEPSSPTSPMSERSRGSSVPTTITAASDAYLLAATHARNAAAQIIPPSQSVPSFELPQTPSFEGWLLLVKLMTEKPDFAAFSRFHDLNVKNLLYYQVELSVISDRLSEFERQDWDTKDVLDANGESDFYQNAEKIFWDKGAETEQFLEIQKMRHCLKDYNEALLQYSQVSSLPEPSTHNMRQLVKWLRSPEGADLKVCGLGSEVWGDQNTEPEEPSLPQQFLNLISFWTKTEPPTRADLVSPRWRGDVDGLTRWLAEEYIPFKEAVKKARKKDEPDDTLPSNTKHASEKTSTSHVEDPEEERRMKESRTDRIKTYSGTTLLKITYRGTTLVACMLPIVAILCLSIVPNLYHKLAMITCFTILFGVAVMCMTEGTRVQVFTATSAFLAVLVVFVPVQSS